MARAPVLPDVAERVLGVLGRSLQALPRFDGTELVELEDPEFEKRFVCHSVAGLVEELGLNTRIWSKGGARGAA